MACAPQSMLIFSVLSDGPKRGKECCVLLMLLFSAPSPKVRVAGVWWWYAGLSLLLSTPSPEVRAARTGAIYTLRTEVRTENAPHS